jgi:hypothetical protein
MMSVDWFDIVTKVAIAAAALFCASFLAGLLIAGLAANGPDHD